MSPRPSSSPDDEGLQRSGADDAADVGDDARDEVRERITDLGHRDGDLALGGLDAARPMTVARTGGLGRPFVAGSPEEGGDLLLDGALDDELGAQAAELTQAIGIVEPIEEHLLDGFLDPGTRGYPWFHGVVLLGELPRSASEPTPSSLLQRSWDATHHRCIVTT